MHPKLIHIDVSSEFYWLKETEIRPMLETTREERKLFIIIIVVVVYLLFK